MKHVSTNKGWFRFITVMGLATLFVGLATLAPVQAQDWQHRSHIRYDMEALRRDQAHLRDLYRRRNAFKALHDWNGVRRTDAAITDTRWRIAHKRYDLRHDFDHFYSDRDRGWFFQH